MTILWAVILGLVQGLAEFLPISFGALGKGTKTPAGQPKRRYPAARLVLMLIIATLPLFLVLPINDKVELLYYKTGFIGAVLILTGVMLYVSDRMPKGTKNEKTMTIGNALIVGLCQAVATIPGLSRSGTTISAGLATGLDREFAVKFSFLLSIPAVLGANLLSLIKAIKEGIDASSLPAYFVGMLVAGVSGYLALGLIHMLVKKGKFGGFAYYCVGAGALAIILSIIL